MSKNTPRTNKEPLPKLRLLQLLPPKEEESNPPTYVNEFRVLGTAESLSINFHFVSTSQILATGEAMNPSGDTRKLEPYMSVSGDCLEVRLPAVARVTMPTTSAMSLAVSILETVIEGAPALQKELQSIAERLGNLDQLTKKMQGNEP